MNRLYYFQGAMAFTVICGLLVALWLAKHSSEQRSLKPLAGFNFLLALWCLGHLLLSFNFPLWGKILLSLNPLMPTAFFHFALLFVADKVGHNRTMATLSRHIVWLYLLSSIVVLLSLGLSADRVEPWLDFPWFLKLNGIGWLNLGYAMVIGIVGHGLLLSGYAKAQGNVKRSIMMMFIVGGWGFTLSSSYIVPSLGLDYYPYLLWLLPSYLLLLTFAVLRYQILAVNYWAIKTLIWSIAVVLLLGLTTLLTSIASPLGLPHLAAIPLWVLWLYSSLTGLMLWLLYQPLHRLASRLVYPDVSITESLIDQWLNQLSNCHSYAQLTEVASQLISSQLAQPVKIAINDTVETDQLLIVFEQIEGKWQFELTHWQDVTPGIRHVADIFASLLCSACINLDKSLQLAQLMAQQEQQRQEELRLVELGGLAAAMAHELRNPLNIISMASAQCEDRVKNHIQSQLKRADSLIHDLLSYAGHIELNCQHKPLLPLLQTLSHALEKQHQVSIGLHCAAPLKIFCDPYKLQQVLVNLLENAAAFCSLEKEGRIMVQCHETATDVVVAIHNNGAKIPATTQQTLFKPFISKRPGGSGLGLAIVQRIMKAHGGDVAFCDQQGWNVSFICHFPKQEQST